MASSPARVNEAPTTKHKNNYRSPALRARCPSSLSREAPYIPAHRFLEPFADAMRRGVAEELPGLGDVGLGMAHVALPELPVARAALAHPREMFHQQRALEFEQLVQGGTFGYRHVVHLV